jgi:hypothetical protein
VRLKNLEHEAALARVRLLRHKQTNKQTNKQREHHSGSECFGDEKQTTLAETELDTPIFQTTVYSV